MPGALLALSKILRAFDRRCAARIEDSREFVRAFAEIDAE